MKNDHRHNRLILLVVAAFIIASYVSSSAATTTYQYDDANRKVTVTRGTPGTAPTYILSGVVYDNYGTPLQGVTIYLSGATSSSTTTDSNGSYGFSGLNSGSYIVTPSRSGCSFAPTSRSATIGGADVLAQNFSTVVAAGGLYATFGTYGLHAWNGSSWTQVNPNTPENMVVSGSLLYGDFGSNGLHRWDGNAWTQINAGNPTSMVAFGSILYAAFAGYGLHAWNGSSWTQINQNAPENMVVSGSMLYADYGSYGLYKWDGDSWTQINAGNPTSVVASF